MVENYLVTEIKPLAETTLDELISLSSSDCADGWVQSSECNSCELRSEAGSQWGDIEIDFGLTSVTTTAAVTQDLSCSAKILGRKFRNIVTSE